MALIEQILIESELEFRRDLGVGKSFLRLQVDFEYSKICEEFDLASLLVSQVGLEGLFRITRGLTRLGGYSRGDGRDSKSSNIVAIAPSC